MCGPAPHPAPGLARTASLPAPRAPDDHCPPDLVAQGLLNPAVGKLQGQCAFRATSPNLPEPLRCLGGVPGCVCPCSLPSRGAADRPRLCPQVLWPYLLEFLTPVRFTGALTPLCKSLVHLVQKRQEVGADAFLIQYDGNGAPRSLPRHPSPLILPLNPASSHHQPHPPTPPHPRVLSGAGALWAGSPLSISTASFPVTLPSPYAITTRLLVSITLSVLGCLCPLPEPAQHTDGVREGVGLLSVPVSPASCCLALVAAQVLPVGSWGSCVLEPSSSPRCGAALRGSHGGGGAWSAWSSHLYFRQTVSSNPYLGDGRGAASLRLLNVLHRSIHPALGPRWATTVPLLLEHLDGEAPGCGRCSSTSDPHLPVCVRVGFWGPEFFKVKETASPKFQGHGTGRVPLLGVTQEHLGCGMRSGGPKHRAWPIWKALGRDLGLGP